MLLLVIQHAQADTVGAIYGSYVNLNYAQERAAAVGAQLGVEVHIVNVQVHGVEYYRVVSYAADRPAAEALARAARSEGLEGAWVSALPDPSSQVSVYARASSSRVATAEQAVERLESIPAQPASDPPAALADPAAASAPAAAEIPRVREDIGTVRLSTDGTEVDIELSKLPVSDVDLRLDGRLDEALWARLPSYDNMLITDPDTLGAPRYKTDTRFFYTDRGMYIGVFMEQPSETLLARLSSRDEFLNRDSWGITLDTSGEGLYGYWFTVNLGGSVMDGKIAAERQYSNEWDGPWQSATAELPNGWSTEMFLPWSMMTMPDADAGVRNFGFWVNRKVAYIDERWSWPALPFQSPRFMSVLATMRTPGVAPKQQIEVFPNVAFTRDEIDGEDEFRAGLDLSWRPTTNLQVTATLNPDFGVVESDDVVVNLSSFETFFPEKRLFFLEGREVFQTTPRNRVSTRGPSGVGSRQTTSTFNPEPTTLLNTRRIGGPPRVEVPDEVDVEGVELGKPSDLLGAFKVTGSYGGLRYGVLSAFEDDVTLPGVVNSGPGAGLVTRVEAEGRDFGVARLLYETTGEGRTSVGYLGTMVRYEDFDAIVHGVDGHWLSPNGLWQLDTQFMHSDVDEVTGNGGLADITFKPTQGVEHKLTLDWLEDTLNIRDLGFIRRNDSRNVIYRYNFSTGRGLTRLRSKRYSVVLSNEWNQQGRLVRSGYFLRNGWTFKNLSEIRTEFDYFPARWDDRNSFGNGDFRTEDRWVAEVGYGTNTSKPISFSALLGARNEEKGDWTVRAALGTTF
ncbi:MAG: DUF5916 domain-containing protein, partial [Pseudomonadota bacterium]